MIVWIAAGAAALVAAGAALGPTAYRNRLRKARDDHSRRPDLWNRFYSLDWGETTTNNYGFAPASGDHPQRFQRQMCLELLRRLKDKREVAGGLKLLEVSCGRGGGLAAFREAAPQVDAVGLDVAETAIDFCRRTYGEGDRLRFVVGSALELPFANSSFDVLLNVEASNDYPDRAQFFCEAARVLKPDGILLYTDTFRAGHHPEAANQLADAGFEAQWDDITDNVIEACRIDSPRRREMIRREAPMVARMLLKRNLENYAAVEGSSKYETFRDRHRGYLMTAATKR
ncbi:MAG: class I SAM-dependent methyltransferase [Sphingomicrobium sp.]